MTTITEPCIVTAAQLASYAGSVNDKRIISEARELATEAGVEPDLVNAIAYEPARGSRKPRIKFVVYDVDENGERLRVHDDGTPYDPELLVPSRYVTKEREFTFNGSMPTWWMQAVKTPVPQPIRED